MASSENTDDKKTPEYKITLIGELIGHNGWVTSIAATANEKIIVSGSRDKTLIVWQLFNKKQEFGRPLKRLYGHEHFVEDVVVSKDGGFALSGSWDKTLRLWNLEEGECTSRFQQHTGDVLSVSFSADNRQICSGSRDKSVILWNTLGERNFTITDKQNQDWITCVEFSPALNSEKMDSEKEPAAEEPQNFNFLLYASGNGSIKKFDLDKLAVIGHYEGHDGPVTALAISPDGSLCASGGKDGRVLLWDLKNGQLMRELEQDAQLVGLRFNPGCYWLAGACEDSLRVWDLVCPEAAKQLICELSFADQLARCTTIEWNVSGNALLCGFTDGAIRVFHVGEKGEAVGNAPDSVSEERGDASEGEFSESTVQSEEE